MFDELGSQRRLDRGRAQLPRLRCDRFLQRLARRSGRATASRRRAGRPSSSCSQRADRRSSRSPASSRWPTAPTRSRSRARCWCARRSTRSSAAGQARRPGSQRRRPGAQQPAQRAPAAGRRSAPSAACPLAEPAALRAPDLHRRPAALGHEPAVRDAGALAERLDGRRREPPGDRGPARPAAGQPRLGLQPPDRHRRHARPSPSACGPPSSPSCATATGTRPPEDGDRPAAAREDAEERAARPVPERGLPATASSSTSTATRARA